jgi:hypothetical protein
MAELKKDNEAMRVMFFSPLPPLSRCFKPSPPSKRGLFLHNFALGGVLYSLIQCIKTMDTCGHSVAQMHTKYYEV